MKITAYLERPASSDPAARDRELWQADRIRRLNGRVMVAIEVGWLATLAHNLAIGAALCRAFRLGREWQAEYLTASWNGGGWTYPFEPGCGRSAP